MSTQYYDMNVFKLSLTIVANSHGLTVFILIHNLYAAYVDNILTLNGIEKLATMHYLS
jgi:hypothetical protein